MSTYNNYTQEKLDDIRVAMLKECDIWVVGKEVGKGPEGSRDPDAIAGGAEVAGLGTPHLQIAIGFKNRRLLKSIIAMFPQGGHWESKHPDATPRSLIGYPLKGDEPKFHKDTENGKCPRGEPAQCETEWCFDEGKQGEGFDGFFSGTFPVGQGKSADADQTIKDIMSGETTYDDILLGAGGMDMMRTNGRVLLQVQDLRNQRMFRTAPCEGFWYYGKSGVGKSHKAFEGWDPKTHYVVPGQAQKPGGFWCGYKGQATVILNEFKGDMPFGELMELCDKWPKNVNIKGQAGVPFIAKKFIITSAVSPEETYHKLKLSLQRNQDGSFDQLYRRFKVVELVGEREPLAKKQRTQYDVGTGEEVDIEPVDVVDRDEIVFGST